MPPPEPSDTGGPDAWRRALGRRPSPRDGLQRRSTALAITLVSIVLAFLALAAFASALEASTTNRMEAARAGAPCQPVGAQVDDDGCVAAPVAPDVIKGVLLGGTVVALQVAARRMHRGLPRGPRP